MSEKPQVIQVTQLPNISKMTDKQIEALAQQIWNKLEKPMK
jgi:hypothetical protein